MFVLETGVTRLSRVDNTLDINSLKVSYKLINQFIHYMFGFLQWNRFCEPEFSDRRLSIWYVMELID